MCGKVKSNYWLKNSCNTAEVGCKMWKKAASIILTAIFLSVMMGQEVVCEATGSVSENGALQAADDQNGEQNDNTISQGDIKEWDKEHAAINKYSLEEGDKTYRPYAGAAYELIYSVNEWGVVIKGCTGEYEGKLVIPETIEGFPVYKIDDYAFYFFGYCGFTGSLDLPETLTSIGIYAFRGCYGLTGNLHIPESVSTLKMGAFWSCNGFTGDLIIPNGITRIEKSVFESCYGFNGRLILPENAISIGEDAFSNCYNLTGAIRIPDSVNTIDKYAFFNCHGINGIVAMRGNVTSIGKGAFLNCSDNLTIYAPRDTYGERYAKSNNYAYVEWDGGSLGGKPLPDDYAFEGIVPKNEFKVIVMDQNAELITDALLEVENNGVNIPYSYADGIISFDSVGDNVTITAKKMGMLQQTVSFYTYGGGVGYLKLLKDIGEPCITSVIMEGTGKDLLRESYSLYSQAKTEQDPVLYVEYQNADPEEFQLIQDEMVISQSETNRLIVPVSELLKGGYHLKVRIMKQGHEISSEGIKLQILSDEWQDKEFGDSIGIGSQLSIKLEDENIPFFSDAELKIDTLIKSPVRMAVADDKVKIYIGDAYDLLDYGTESGYNKLRSKVMKEWNTATFSKEPYTKKIAGFDTVVNIAGYGEGRIDSASGGAVIKAGIYVRIKCGNGIIWYTLVGPVPVYTKVTGEAENQSYGMAVLTIKDGKLLNSNLDINNTVEVKIGAGAGVGLNDTVCIDMTASGILEWEHKEQLLQPSESKDSITLQGNVKARAIVLFMSYEREWSSEEWKLYPRADAQSTSAIPEIFNSSSYHIMSRDYVMDSEAEGKIPELNSQQKDKEEESIIINGIYPDAKPQLVKYKGVNYLFYLDDLQSRGDEDRTALMYRIYNGTGWSKAKIVDDDKTADFAFDAVAGEDGIYVVWQNAKDSLYGINNLNVAAEHISLKSAKVTESTIMLFPDPSVTAGCAPISPSIIQQGKDIWIGWYENSTNNLLQNSIGTNSFYVESIGQNGRIKLGETDLGVITADFGIWNGFLSAAFTGDQDGDSYTINDRDIFLMKNSNVENLTNNNVFDSHPQFIEIEDRQRLFYYSDHNYHYIDGEERGTIFQENDLAISDDYMISSDDSGIIILWKNSSQLRDNTVQTLNMATYHDYEWSAPEQVAYTPDSLMDYTLGKREDGTIRLVYTVYSQQDGNEITRLLEKEAVGTGNVAIAAIEYDENQYVSGESFPIKLILRNDTQYQTDDCKIIIRNSEGEIIYSKNVPDVPQGGTEVSVYLRDFYVEDHGDLKEYYLQVICNNQVNDSHVLNIGGAEYEINKKITFDEGLEILNLKIKNSTNFSGGINLSFYEEKSQKLLRQIRYEVIPAGGSAYYTCKLAELYRMTDELSINVRAESLGRSEADLTNNEVILYNPAGWDEMSTVKLAENELSLIIGQTLQLGTSFVPENAAGTELIWYSNNPECVSVDSTGNIKANAEGIATIIVTAENGISDKCVVEVKGRQDDVESVQLDQSDITIEVNEQKLLTVFILPDNIEAELSWESRDKDIAVVEGGMVTALKPGETFITVEALNGKTDNCRITVRKPYLFKDVSKSSWYYDGTDFAYQNSFMNGISSTKFSPESKLTRSQFATVLYSYAGSPEVIFENCFEDIVPGQWYSNAVIWAAEAGITAGYANGKFGVTDEITREQFVTMLYAYARYCGYVAEINENLSEVFNDTAQISNWAAESVQWAVHNGLLSGKPAEDGGIKLDPKNSTTRAECAVIMMQYSKCF